MLLKKVLAPLAVIAVSLAVVACGSSSSGSSKSASSATQAPSTQAVNGGGKTFLFLSQGSSSAFTNAIADTVAKNFDSKFNYKIAFDVSCCGIDKLKAMESTGNVTYSAVNLATYADFAAAKKAGLLLPLDQKIVPLNLVRAEGRDPYGYDAYNFAPVVAWLPKSYPAGTQAPTAFQDAFSTTFPGKRCLYKGPQIGGTYEGALLAAGVPKTQLYPIDYSKAFAQLNKIKSDTVWYSDPAQAVQFLQNGTCKMAVIWNGVAQTAALTGTPMKVAWKNSPIIPAYIAIPKGSPNALAAQHFLAAFLTDRTAEEQLLAKTAYPPSLKSLALPSSVQQWAPIGPNYDAGFLQNQQWYITNMVEATKEFNDYIVTGSG